MESKLSKVSPDKKHYMRFHFPHAHLASTFGDDWFALKAESFARFFGTPIFLIAQTLIVVVWIALNELGILDLAAAKTECNT